MYVSHRVYEAVVYPLEVVQYAHQSTRKIQDLERRYNQALAQISELEGLRAENTELRMLIENTDRKLEEVKVVETVISVAEPTITGGLQGGVSEGNEVVIQGTLVGFVDQVSQRLATVRLLSRDDAHPVIVKTETGVEGIVIGNGKNIILTEVSPGDVLTVGERIVTVGQPGVVSDRLVGIISKIEKNPTASVQTALVEQLVDFRSSRVAEVYK
jgi:cell shape-determining protein MreC